MAFILMAIAPISVGNKLLAFLVAHQCSKLQPWHFEAVSFLTEKANITGFALSNIVKTQKSEVNLTNQVTESQQKGNSPIMDRMKNGNENGNENGIIKPIDSIEPKTKVQENINSSFAEVNEKIANELGQENILNTTVKEVRHLLNCDKYLPKQSQNSRNYWLATKASGTSILPMRFSIFVSRSTKKIS